MKEKIKAEDINGFKHDSNIFGVLLLCIIVLPIPLMHFMGNVGVAILGLIAIGSMYYAIRVEKYKKNFNIQTYREILVFFEGKSMGELEKIRSMGKDHIRNFC